MICSYSINCMCYITILGGIMMQLTPDRVNAVVGSIVRFTCSYNSFEPLIIEFDESFSGVQATSPTSYNTAIMMSLLSHNWGAEKFWNVEIKLQHEMISCRVRNRDGVVLGTLSSMIHPYIDGLFVLHLLAKQCTVSVYGCFGV